jgi:hypothetical protein
MPIATRAFRNLGNRNGGSLGGNPEWRAHLESLGDGSEFTLRPMRAPIDADESQSLRLTPHSDVLSGSADNALTFAAPGLATAAPATVEVLGDSSGFSLAYGGGISFAGADMLATMGLGAVTISKLQAGLAEIYLESQMQLSGLSGVARDAALAGFHSSNSEAILDGGMVAIDAVAINGNGAALLAQLEALGMQRGASFGAMAGGLIPLDAIDDLANLGLLAFARPVYADTNVGTVTSQNDPQMLTDDVRTMFGVNGSGITIGVLSDSFNTRVAPLTNYTQDVTSGDLPAGANILADGPAGRSDEGRAMAQLAFDVAPGAQFAFHTAFVSMADFASGIVELAQAGSDIIVDDVRYFAEPFFQDGILNQAVNTAYDLGAMYFSSAGNYGVRSYESVYRNSGQTFVNGAVTYVLHDFDSGAGVDTTQTVTQNAPASGNAVNYVLQWDQPFLSIDPTSGGSINDLALIFRTTGGGLIGVVDGANIGGDPIELGGLNGSGALTLSIGVRAGVDPGIVKYVTIGGNSFVVNEHATNSGTSYGHSNADHAIAVGAADWIDSPEFGQTPPLSENFSSLGGVPILFNPDGTRLAQPEIRDHVEFTAGDGGNTTFFSSDRGDDADTFPNFFGTSAAAPNAAAFAALLMQMFPTATRTQIELAMKASAIDIQNDWAGGVTGVGNDRTTGTGLIQGPAAVAALQAILNALPNGTGSIAIVAYNTGQSDGSGNPATTDGLRFVALDAIAAGTVIYFTDRTWNGTAFVAGGSDGVATYTVGGGGLAAGQTVSLTGAALGTLNPEEAADTIYAYQGTSADAPVQFLFAIEIGDGNTSFGGSLANTGLVNGVTAVAVGLDSASYQGPTTEAFAHLYNGESLLENIADFANWEGDNRSGGGVNALDHPDHNGPYYTAPDISLWSAASGGGDAITVTHGDSTVTNGFNLSQLYTLDNEDLADTFVVPKDIVFDTARGLFFVADSNLTGGTNRILQGNIADLLGNPGTAPPLTVLYTSNQAPGTEAQIFNLEVDPNNGIIYFTHGMRFEKILYNTPGQTSTVLANFGTGSGNPVGSTNNFMDDFVINFATGSVYFTSHRVSSAQDGDNITRNFLYRITGLDSADGTNAFTFGNGLITVMPFSPDDDDVIHGGLDIPGEAFPRERGSLEGLALSADGSTLYFATASVLFDHDGDGGFSGPGGFGTPPQLAMGGIYSYALSGNAAGTYTLIYQQVAGTGPQGLLDDLEVDPVTGQIYFLDLTGLQVSPISNPPGDEGIWRINANGTGLTFFQTISNINALTAGSLYLNRAPTVTSSTQATPTTTEVAGLGSGFSNLVQPFTALDVTDADSNDQTNQLGGAVVRISSGFQSGAGHQDRLTINGNTSGVLDFGSQDITYSYNSATGVMTLTGASTFNNYEAAIALVRFSVSGDNPTNYGSNTTRAISWTVSDGLDHSDEVSTTITVTGVNDAPVNAVPASDSGAEDTSFAINGLSVSDVDADPATQNITVTLTVTRGILTINGAVPGGLTPADITNNGTASVTLVGTQNEINATLGNATAVQFAGGTNANGTVTFTITTNDGGFNGNDPGLTGTGTSEQDSDQFTVTITAVNDAPTVVGDGTESLANIFEDTHPAGTSVNTLLSGQYSDQADNQTAFPGGSSAGAFTGIAVIGNGSSAGTGQWQWSTDGISWTNIGTITPATARLYSNTIQVRFDPAANFNGPAPTLTVRLIDNSLGFGIVNGQVVDLSNPASVGGTTAYSSGTVVLNQQIDPVNDAPTSTNLSGDAVTYNEGAVSVLLDLGSNATVADIDSANFDTGTLTVSITNVVAAQDQLLIVPSATITVVGNTVLFNAVQFGTFTGGGAGGGALVFTFDPDATPAAVQALISAIGYTNSDVENPTAGTRNISWTLVDGDGIANGGADTLTVGSTVTIVAVNDAPAGTDHTATVNEDATYTFAAADFGYSDVDGNAFSGVRFTTLPLLGTIFLDTDGPGGAAPVAVSAGDIVALSEITAGHVYYVPAANGNGVGYSSFTFQVRDNGGTLNGGLDLDQSPNTFTFDVNSVNDAPTSTNLNGDIATWTEGGSAVLLDVGSNATIADIDSANFDGGTLTVTLTGGVVAQDGLFIETVGLVTSTANTVSVGGVQIATYVGGGFGGGNIVFTFDADATPAAVQALMGAISYNNNGGISPTGGARSVTWTLVDGDGTANGGADTLLIGSTVDVVSINDAPTGTDASFVINEDSTYTFTAASFGFSDINGDPFAGVVVTTIPVPGTLFYDADGAGGGAAVAVTAGQFISASEIALGHLYYTPVLDGNGVPFSSFTFQVRDTGGTAAGGVDTDQSANTITFNVTAVNDAPVNSVPGLQTINEDGSFTLSTGNGNAISVSDVDATTLTVTLSVAHGTLTIASSAGLTFSGGSDGTADTTMTFSGTAAAINAALGSGLTYNPNADFNGSDALSVVTTDGGQTGTGPVGTDSDSIAINITAINDAPVVIGDGTETATTIAEDTPGAGQTIQALFAGQYSDAADNQIPNGGASSPGQFSGIAVTANGSSGATGQWQYFSGGVWTNIGAASDAAAVLLGDPFVTLIRFNPAPDYNGPAPTLTVHLIDNSLPFGIVNGQIVNLSGPGATGGTTAYSTGTVVLSQDVTAVNDAPVNTVPGAQTINEDASFTLSTGNGNAISVADVDATTLTVTLTVANGTMTLASAAGLSFGTGDGTADATMTFSGTAAAINAALGSGLTYNPTANYNGPDAISVTTTDGGQAGSGGVGTDNDTVNITINSVNDAPSGADNTVVASEDDPYVFTAADFGFTDPVEGDDFLAVIIDSFPANGTLFLDSDGPGGAAPVDLSTLGPGVFVSVTDINAGHLYFQPDPDEFGDNYASFTFRVQDDGGMLNGGVDRDPVANTITIDVGPDNFTPVVDLDSVAGGVNHAATFTENGASVSIGTGISVSDADSVNGDLIESATVTLTDMVAGDMLTYTGPPPPPGITVVVNVMVGSIVVTITGPGTGAQYAALLEDIEYSSISDDPTFGGTDPTRTITVTVSDGTIDSAVATTTVTINAVDDAPTAQPDAYTITESGTIVAGNVFANNGSGADSDLDGPPLSVSEVNGSGANVGTQITLASGALLTLNANGTFDYNPNGAFLPTPLPGSGASNTPGVDSFTYTLAGGNTVTVTITLTGLDTDDLMLGTAGADTLIADGGTDTLQGLGGDDTYYVNSSAHIVLEAAGGGNDIVYASSNYALTAGQEVETLSADPAAGAAPLVLVGNDLVNAINGNAGANTLDGGSGGADTLTGGDGNDIYYVDGDDSVVEGATEGNRDVIYARTNYILAAATYVEVLSTVSQVATTAINLTGNGLVNEIYGNAGVNVLDGRAGADFLIGLGGNDIYYVDTAADEVVEASGEGGRDAIYSEVDYTLAAGADVEVLSAISAAATTAMNLTGNALANEIFGNNGVNVLDGGGGSDYLRGFLGNDVYYVDDPTDIVIEQIGEGRDVVYASGNAVLTGASEIEVLSTISQEASTAINLTGNAFAQEIYGNAGANVIDGKDGDDFLIGLSGADSYAFTTSIGFGNVDTIVGFDGVGSDGDDMILLDDAIFTGLALGALDPNAFHVGTAAADADDRIIYNSATGAIYFDADGNGAGVAIQFATLEAAPALTSSDFTVI